VTQVVIQPSYGSAGARRRWGDTLDKPVRFVEPLYAGALGTDQLAELHTVHPFGEARFWGATGKHDKNMSNLTTGDVVLFTGQKHVRAVGEVGISFRNPAFADLLWPPDPESGSWSNVYSLLRFQPVHIPYEEIWDLPGFNQGDNFQSLRFLDEQKGQDILAGLSIETAAAAHQADQQGRLVENTLLGGQVIPPEVINSSLTSYSHSGGTVLVRRAEALLVQEYRGTLYGQPVDRFRAPDGGLTDLYVRGTDGAEIIEAKRGADRTFVRQALSQLLDYAPHSPEPAVRLAALFPTRPADPSIELLHRYGVDCIYRTAPGSFIRLAAPDNVREYMRKRWTPSPTP
jgi:hypothetical protein